jgi:hypothetical protein
VARPSVMNALTGPADSDDVILRDVLALPDGCVAVGVRVRRPERLARAKTW